MVDKHSIPADAYLSETHEYVRTVDKDIARIGITEYAAEQLGDIVFVELPDVGDSFEKGESFGSIESVKASSELYMPVSCEVTAVNERLSDSPETVNDDAFNGGWMIEVSLSNVEDLNGLMSAEQYVKFVAESN